mgnify:CR=1 FL=1
MKNYYYYYKIDKKNNPLPGSNFKREKKISEKNVVEFIPHSKVCCSGNLDYENLIVGVNYFYKVPYRYLVRTDENNNPIDMTLIKTKNRSFSQGYQTVYPISCCSEFNI